MNEAASVRDKLGLSAEEWADVLGVGQSSVYRWEANSPSRIDPGTLRIYTLLLSMSPTRLKEIGQKVRYARIRRGGLYGLQVLISEALK